MTEQIAGTSTRLKGRLAGVAQLLEGVGATFGQIIVLGKVVVIGDIALTATNILAHERLYWLGFAISLLGVVFHAVWIILFFDLFKPVNKTVALLAVFTGAVECAMQAVTALIYLSPLIILKIGSTQGGMTTQQLQVLAAIFLKLNAYAFYVHTMFFGVWCILTGYLIFNSTFLPRVLGVLLAISGLGWLMYLYPPFAVQIFPVLAVASAIGEIPLEFWMMIKSVDVPKGQAQARALPVSGA
jgi:hypothetical protein